MNPLQIPGLHRVNDKRMDLCLPFVIGFVKECSLCLTVLRVSHDMAIFFLTFGFHSAEGINVIEWVGAGPRTNLNERPGLYSEKKTNNKNKSFSDPMVLKMAPNSLPRIFS